VGQPRRRGTCAYHGGHGTHARFGTGARIWTGRRVGQQQRVDHATRAPAAAIVLHRADSPFLAAQRSRLCEPLRRQSSDDEAKHSRRTQSLGPFCSSGIQSLGIAPPAPAGCGPSHTQLAGPTPITAAAATTTTATTAAAAPATSCSRARSSISLGNFDCWRRRGNGALWCSGANARNVVVIVWLE
jgi:hypothetical protein